MAVMAVKSSCQQICDIANLQTLDAEDDGRLARLATIDDPNHLRRFHLGIDHLNDLPRLSICG